MRTRWRPPSRASTTLIRPPVGTLLRPDSVLKPSPMDTSRSTSKLSVVIAGYLIKTREGARDWQRPFGEYLFNDRNGLDDGNGLQGWVAESFWKGVRTCGLTTSDATPVEVTTASLCWRLPGHRSPQNLAMLNGPSACYVPAWLSAVIVSLSLRRRAPSARPQCRRSRSRTAPAKSVPHRLRPTT